MPCNIGIVRRSWQCAQEGLVLRRQTPLAAGLLQQLWALLGGEAQALLTPPALNVGMVARQQRRRHAVALPHFGAGVVRAIEQTIQGRIKAVLLKAARVIEHPRLQAGDGIEQHQRGQLTAGENKIPQADVVGDVGINKALVDAFVTPTQQNGPAALGPLRHRAMVQGVANG